MIHSAPIWAMMVQNGREKAKKGGRGGWSSVKYGSGVSFYDSRTGCLNFQVVNQDKPETRLTISIAPQATSNPLSLSLR